MKSRTAAQRGRDTVRLAPGGDMDSERMAHLRLDVEAASGAGHDVCLDMRGVASLDGSGIGGIAYLYKRLSSRGLRLTVHNAAGQPLALLRDLGISRVLGAEPGAPATEAA